MIDSSKKYRTRSGLEARLYANDGAGAWPIHGAVNIPSSGWSLRQWHEGGCYSNNGPHDLDLIEVRPERWHPVMRSENSSYYYLADAWYETKDEALKFFELSPRHNKAIDAWKAPE